MKELLLHLAELSKLSFSDSELEMLSDDFTDIFALFDTVRDFSKTFPDTSLPTDRLREDTPEKSSFKIDSLCVPRVVQ